MMELPVFRPIKELLIRGRVIGRCAFCEDYIRLNDDTVEVRTEAKQQKKDVGLDVRLDKKTKPIVWSPNGTPGRARVAQLSSRFMHRACWNDYKISGRRPKKWQGMPLK